MFQMLNKIYPNVAVSNKNNQGVNREYFVLRMNRDRGGGKGADRWLVLLSC